MSTVHDITDARKARSVRRRKIRNYTLVAILATAVGAAVVAQNQNESEDSDD